MKKLLPFSAARNLRAAGRRKKERRKALILRNLAKRRCNGHSFRLLQIGGIFAAGAKILPLLTLTAAFIPQCAYTEERYGLFVGINKFTLAGCSTLSGCVNDAIGLRTVYTSAETGYCAESNAELLTDYSATKEAIRAGFGAIALKARSGDVVVYYQSSHGGQNGETTSAYLCATDATYSDDEFASDLTQFASGVNVIVILDTCHSAGMFKADAAAETVKEWNFARKVNALLAKKLSEAAAKSGESRSGPNVGWMTACDWMEYSYDYGFTPPLVEGWASGAADSDSDGKLSAWEIFQYAKDNCTKMQTPQYENRGLLLSVVMGKAGSDVGSASITIDGADSDWIWTLASGDASTDYFTIGCSGEWKAGADVPWIALSPVSGTGNATVNIDFAANPGKESRQGTITATCGSTSHRIAVTQPGGSGATSYFMVNGVAGDSSISLDSSAAEGVIEISCNSAWSVASDSEWINLGQASGLGNGAVNVWYDENPRGTARTGRITVSSGGISYAITVTQAANPNPVSPTTFLTLGGESRDWRMTLNTSGASSYTFAVGCSGTWAAMANAAWISLSPTSGVGNGTVQAAFAANNSGAERTGAITLTSGTLSVAVAVTQPAGSDSGGASAYLRIDGADSDSTWTLYSYAESTDYFQIECNGSWTASSSASWISISPSGGAGEATVDLSFAANLTQSARTGVIAVQSGKLSHTITITQPANPNPPSSSTTLAINGASGNVAWELETPAAHSRYFTVGCNSSWTASTGGSWFSLSRTSGTGSGTVNVYFEPNPYPYSRNGAVVLSSGLLKRTLTIVQPAAGGSVALAIDGRDGDWTWTLDDCARSSEFFMVSCAAEWTVETDAGWIEPSTGGGVGDGRVSVVFAANPYGTARTGVITVASRSLVRTITVIQPANPHPAPTPDSLMIDGKTEDLVWLLPSSGASAKTFEVVCEGEWSVASDVAWTSLNTSGRTGDGVVTVSFPANTLASARNVRITVRAGSLSRTISVIQPGTATGANLRYAFGPQGATVTGWDGPTGNLLIPSSVNGKPVVAIANFAFFREPGVTSVTIPASITNIGEKAFRSCTNLRTLVFETRTAPLTVSKAAFQGCNSLEEVELPKGVTYLFSSTFEDCDSLHKVVIPEGVTAIGSCCFSKCKSLSAITMPSSVREIRSFAFFSCESLVSVSLGKVTAIGEKAFKNTASLASIALPGTLTSLGKAAFFNSGLTRATIPPRVKSIGAYCYQNCGLLASVTLPAGLEEIGDGCWANDTALSSIWIPASVKRLGPYAFFGCDALSDVYGGDGLESIGEKAYKYCYSLKTLVLPSSISVIPREMCNSCARLVHVECGHLAEVLLGAFGKCPSLQSVSGLDAQALERVKRGLTWSRQRDFSGKNVKQEHKKGKQ